MNEPDITVNSKEEMKDTENIMNNSVNSSKIGPKSSTITQNHTNKISRSSSDDSDLEIMTDTKKSSITIEEKISPDGCRDRYSKMTSTNTPVCSKNKSFSSNGSSKQSVENYSRNKSSALEESVRFLYEVSQNIRVISTISDSSSESSDDESLESDIEIVLSEIEDMEVSSAGIQKDSENIKSKRSEWDAKPSESSEGDSEDKSSKGDDGVLFVCKISSASTKACSKNTTLCPSNKKSTIEGSENESFVPNKSAMFVSGVGVRSAISEKKRIPKVIDVSDSSEDENDDVIFVENENSFETIPNKSAMFVSGVPSAFTLAGSKNIPGCSHSKSTESDSDSEDEEATALNNSVVTSKKKRIPKVIDVSDSSEDENDDVVFVEVETIDLSSDETASTSAMDNSRYDSSPDIITLSTNTNCKNKRKRNQRFPSKKRKLVHNNGDHSGRTNNNHLNRGRHLNTPALSNGVDCFKKKGNESSNERDRTNGNIIPIDKESIPQTRLRPIVIDGDDVGRGWGDDNVFRFKTVLNVIDYFKKRGHTDITCFLPDESKYCLFDYGEIAKCADLEKQGIIAYRPERGEIEGASVQTYDRFIVQYATDRNGVIVSNNDFRYLAWEDPSWKDTIEKRILNHTSNAR